MTTFDSNLFAKLENGAGYNATNEGHILNPYVAFNSYENVQTLQDALVAESIQMRGVVCYYLPSEFVHKDELFGEDPSRKFKKSWKFAAYLDSFEGYSGANTFFGKFGMQVEDEVTITVNPNLFKHQVNGQEPKEGDLFYFELDNALFEITWVEPYNPFYQVGTNAMRRITAQKFIYSGEEIKPVLQRNEGIYIEEFSELDLEPLNMLNDKHDIKIPEYVEDIQIEHEAAPIVQPFVVINNKGINSGTGPFDNFVD